MQPLSVRTVGQAITSMSTEGLRRPSGLQVGVSTFLGVGSGFSGAGARPWSDLSDPHFRFPGGAISRDGVRPAGSTQSVGPGERFSPVSRRRPWAVSSDGELSYSELFLKIHWQHRSNQTLTCLMRRRSLVGGFSSPRGKFSTTHL